MAKFTTYDQVGKKEDVSDVINMLDKQDTPFTSALGTRKIHNVLYSWQEDEQLPGGDNAQVEGFDAVEEPLETTKMLDNTTQIFSRTFKTTGTLEAIGLYGRKNERARQLVKKGKQVRQDFEYACIRIEQEKNLGSDTVARRFANAFGLVDPTCFISNAADPLAPVARALQEDTLKAAIRKSYNEGSHARTLLVAPPVAEQTAEFAGNASRTREVTAVKATTITHVVDVYVTALGSLTIETARLMKPDYGLLFKKGTYKKAVLPKRDWHTEVLAKTGDNTKTMILGEFGLTIDNSKGAVVITDIDPELA